MYGYPGTATLPKRLPRSPFRIDLTTAEYWDRSLAIAGVAKDTWYRRLARRHFDRFLHGILYDRAAPPRVLELGCAPGRMLTRLQGVRSDCHFEGIDFAQDGVAATRQALAHHGVRARIHSGDVRAISLPQPYDVVVSFGLIEHFDDPVSILRHHARLCRPGGCVAITVPNFAPWLVKRLAYWSAPEVAATHNFEIMNHRVLEEAMQAAGLQGVQVGSFGGPRVWMAANRDRWSGRVYQGLARMWNFAASLLPGEVLWQGTYWATGYRVKTAAPVEQSAFQPVQLPAQVPAKQHQLLGA